MQPRTIEIRLRDADELRMAWLDGLQDGGVFVPGAFELGAGAPVILRVMIERPVATTTVLIGSVVWRRLPAREPAVSSSSITLRAGIGVSFASSMRARALFLERIARGAASEVRAALRYPTEIAGEVAARTSERAAPARLLDVSVHGARLYLGASAFLETGAAIELRIAAPTSGELSRAPLGARVAWIDRSTGQHVGVRLDLGTTDERLIWAKIVTRAREALEEQPIRVDRLVS